MEVFKEALPEVIGDVIAILSRKHRLLRRYHEVGDYSLAWSRKNSAWLRMGRQYHTFTVPISYRTRIRRREGLFKTAYSYCNGLLNN